tara:strand:- start:938 stop:1168 length:231 start_codon:yes stop_codon:yes gene_type:complete
MSQYHTTYLLYPNNEEKETNTPFFKNDSPSFLDYLNLLMFCGGGAFLFFYFLDSFDSFGYILFVFGIIIVCEIMII